MSRAMSPSLTQRDEVDEAELPPHGIAASAVAIAVLSSFMFGYSICVLDSCGELVSVFFHWCGNSWQSDCVVSRTFQGAVNAALYLGATVGALLVGRPRLAAKGSRTLLCIADTLFFLGAIRCATAQGAGALILGRIISGLGLGIAGVAAPLYICEVSPREHRGRYTMMHQVFISLGILASIAFGLPQSPAPSSASQPLVGLDSWYWRGLLGLPAVPALLQLLLFCWIFPLDPPGLLIARGRLTDARRVLYKIYGIDFSDGARLSGVEQSRAIAVEFQFQELIEATETAQSLPRIPIMLAFFDPFLRCAMCVGFGLAAFQQLCGINAVMSYSNSFFREAGISADNLTLASTIMAAMNVLMSLATAKVVDKWGRRSLLLGGAACQALAMGGLSLCLAGSDGASVDAPAPVVIGCFCFFVMSFAGGVGSVTWLYLSEIYPLEIRGAALGSCGSVNWFCSFAVVFASRLMTFKAACHFFGCVCLAGVWGIYLWVVETKGCSMDDSPMTPRNQRSRSPLMTPLGSRAGSQPSSPKADFRSWPESENEGMTVAEKMTLLRSREVDHC